jgi:hypothetical protein
MYMSTSTKYHLISLSDGITARVAYSAVLDIRPAEVDEMFKDDKRDMSEPCIPMRPKVHYVEFLQPEYEARAFKINEADLLLLDAGLQLFIESRLQPISGAEYYGI